MGGFSNPNDNEKEEGLEQDVVFPEFVDINVEQINNVNSNLNNSSVAPKVQNRSSISRDITY